MMAVIRLACAAGVLAIGLLHGAAADEAYWHGVRSDDWRDGLDPSGAISNWYTEAPPDGAPAKVPGGRAIFAPGALRTNLKITQSTSISQISFTPDAPLYTFRLARHTQLFIRRALTNQSATVTPRFTVLLGARIKLTGTARLISAGPAESARITVTHRGKLDFEDDSHGGDAVVMNTGDITFLDNASAERMTITNKAGGETIFFGRSSGGMAHLINEEGGRFGLATRTFVGRVENDGMVSVGRVALGVRENFSQTGNGRLSLVIEAPTLDPRVEVRGIARLGGSVAAHAWPKAGPGVYRIMTAEGGVRGRFAELRFTGRPDLTARLAYSGTEVNLIVRRK